MNRKQKIKHCCNLDDDDDSVARFISSLSFKFRGTGVQSAITIRIVAYPNRIVINIIIKNSRIIGSITRFHRHASCFHLEPLRSSW